MSDSFINHLAYLARSEKLELLKSELLSLRRPILKSANQMQAVPDFEEIRFHLSHLPELQSLLKLRLISETLLFSCELPHWVRPWVEEHMGIHPYYNRKEWERMRSGAWAAVPVAVVLDKSPRLRYFMIGLLPNAESNPSWPDWANPLMAETTKKSIVTARNACSRRISLSGGFGFYCYPLAIPNNNVQFTGGSLGLPFAIGFMALLTAESVSESVLATGTIDEQGRILGVEQIEAKATLAGREKYSLFLYPSENSPPPAPEFLEILPVSHIDQARMCAVLHAPDRANDLIKLSGMIEDPENFARTCDSFPAEWLDWMNREGITVPTMERVCNSAESFNSFVTTFERCLEKWKLERCEALKRMADPDLFSNTTKITPLATFKWHMLTMALANHRGRVEEAIECSKRAEALLEKARQQNLDICAEYHNHKFVSVHNLYQFAPLLPEEVQKTLDFLKERYALNCRTGCTTDKTLGGLYGSIAQNFGFCGQEYIDDVEKYTVLAQRAFGDGEIPECIEGWLRPLHYLTYGALEAGLMEKASNTLLRYFQIEKWEDLWPAIEGFDQWQHALLARFLADAESTSKIKRYFDLVYTSRNQHLKPEHPYQLWAYNMGRLAKRLGLWQEAVDAFAESLALCLSREQGPTVHVMALLPLSGLQQMGELKRVDLTKAEKAVRSAAERLNHDHFQLLKENDLKTVLKKVWEQPGKLFPFTYH